MVSGSNRAKLALAALTAVAGAGLLALVVWGGGYTMLMQDAPFLQPSQAHPLGTNEMGEDVLSKIALGGRELLLPVVAALAAAVLLGGLFGTWSGLCLGSSADTFMDLYAELWESVPKLVLVFAALTYMSYEHYTLKLYLLIGIAFAPLVYRAVRNEVGALRTRLFLEASVALGISRGRIFWTHVVRRHVLPVLCVEGAVLMGYVLLFDAILGYCGVRQYAEVQSWGSLLGTALDELPRQIDAGIAVNPWTMWGPFSAMLLGIIASSFVGDALKSLGRSVRAGQ
jgi:peptide/nickel transport system permease protein